MLTLFTGLGAHTHYKGTKTACNDPRHRVNIPWSCPLMGTLSTCKRPTTVHFVNTCSLIAIFNEHLVLQPNTFQAQNYVISNAQGVHFPMDNKRV